MPASFARARVSVPDRVLTRVVSGSTVLLDVGNGRSFTLDATGSRVWALLAESGSPDVAFDVLMGEFDVDADDLRRDLDALVGQLAASGLLHVHEDLT
jgi:hypothetical protein